LSPFSVGTIQFKFTKALTRTLVFGEVSFSRGRNMSIKLRVDISLTLTSKLEESFSWVYTASSF
jgi:hypothetical protein